MYHVRKQTRGAFSLTSHYLRRRIGKLAGYDDMALMKLE
jgi:hypothetical protein